MRGRSQLTRGAEGPAALLDGFTGLIVRASHDIRRVINVMVSLGAARFPCHPVEPLRPQRLHSPTVSVPP